MCAVKQVSSPFASVRMRVIEDCSPTFSVPLRVDVVQQQLDDLGQWYVSCVCPTDHCDKQQSVEEGGKTINQSKLDDFPPSLLPTFTVKSKSDLGIAVLVRNLEMTIINHLCVLAVHINKNVLVNVLFLLSSPFFLLGDCYRSIIKNTASDERRGKL